MSRILINFLSNLVALVVLPGVLIVIGLMLVIDLITGRE